MKLIVLILFFSLVCGYTAVEADLYGVLDSTGSFRFVNIPTKTVRIAYRKNLKSPFEKPLQRAADQFALDPDFLRAVMKSESNFKPNVVSKAGARGLMQLMPRTARILGVRDIDNPTQNVKGGARYLRRLLNWFEGDRELAAAAYNAGSLAVRKYNGVPPYKETMKYVDKVLAQYKRYRRK